MNLFLRRIYMSLEVTDVTVVRTGVLVQKFLINEEDDQKWMDGVMRRVDCGNTKLGGGNFS